MIQTQLQRWITMHRWTSFAYGIGLTVLLAWAAGLMVGLPAVAVLGQMVLAILLGMAWRQIAFVPEQSHSGIAFASKHLLRAGIVLLGLRLDFNELASAGLTAILLSAVNIVITIAVIAGLARLFKLDRKTGFVTAIGTAICGAAAIAAISPVVKANPDQAAVGIATVSILGTVFTLGFTVLKPVLGLPDNAFGYWAGASLHEIAHVVAAAAPFGESALNTAVMVKLTRVSLLVPAALICAVVMNRAERQKAAKAGQPAESNIKIPWFVVWFLVVGIIHSLGLIPAAAVSPLLTAAYFALAAAMAGMGLSLNPSSLQKGGLKAMAACLAGSVLLSFISYGFMKLLY
ncbi:YeiH family protein [Paenibacillus sp. y28]|uniref:YeiH family protein n=1 Tax=Paenibacillus sp. y28 TaxID=3129110 RepID=UPI003017A877